MKSQTPAEQVRFYFTDTDEVFLTDSGHTILACRYAMRTRLLGYLEPEDPLDAARKFTRAIYTPGIRVVPDLTACRVHPEGYDPETERTKPLCQTWYWPKEYHGAYPVVSEVQLMDAADYLQHLQYFNERQHKESERIRTAIAELEKGRKFKSDQSFELDYFISRLRGFSPEEESRVMEQQPSPPFLEGEPQTLEGKVGENIIWQLKEGDTFRELLGYLREHGLAEDWNVKNICCTAVRLALDGHNAEGYAQAVLSELRAKKDWVSAHPGEVRFISVEKERDLRAAKQQPAQVSVWDRILRLFDYKYW